MVAFHFLAGIINQYRYHLCKPQSTPKDLHVTILFFATDIHGSSIRLSSFLDQGKFCSANRSTLRGNIKEQVGIPFAHQGGKDHRITLLEQVFNKIKENRINLFKRARSPGYLHF
jgi:hypothetical protein